MLNAHDVTTLFVAVALRAWQAFGALTRERAEIASLFNQSASES